MRSMFAILGLAGCVAAQAVTAVISASGAPPPGCTATHTAPFLLTIETGSASAGKRNAEPMGPFAPIRKRQDQNGQLLLELNNGILHDSKGRTGYVASNYQFQFDAPPQAGALYTAGFSICPNNTIAHGDSTVWYSCSSGSSFDNLYDRPWAPYCKPAFFGVVPAPAGATSEFSSIASTGSTAAPSTGSSSASTAAPSSATSAASAPATMSTPMAAPTPASNGTVTSASPTASATIAQGAAVPLASGLPQMLAAWAIGAAGLLAAF